MIICHKLHVLFSILAKPTVSTATMCGVSNSNSSVISKCYGDKGIITLNRPKSLNTINTAMIKSILETLKKWETCKTLVIMKGAGEKSFCAGGDVRELSVVPVNGQINGFNQTSFKMNWLIGNYKIPFITFIDGITMGGGACISMMGRYRVATEKTLFSLPETAIGLFPGFGGSYFLPKFQAKLGLYLGLTGSRLEGEDVFKAGIATHYCPSKNLLHLEEELLKCNYGSDINRILGQFSSSSNKDFDSYLNSENIKKMNECFAAPTVEVIVQNLKKDGSKWAMQTLDTLSKMSPTSLKVTHRVLELGSSLSLAECLKMEYAMGIRFALDSDFPEGVRALLIDKDKNPKWKPSTLEEVTENRVNYYFTKLPDRRNLKL